MSLFKNLFAKKPVTPLVSPEELALRERFRWAWGIAVMEFGNIVGLGSIVIEWKDPVTQVVTPPWEAVNPTYNAWAALRSRLEQRTLLFDAIAEISDADLAPWQNAEYLVANRRAAEALKVIEQGQPVLTSSPKHGHYCAAFARTLLTLDRLEEGLTWSKQAAEAMPENRRIRLLHADILHMTGATTEAHAIYDPLLKAVPQIDSDSDDAIREMFIAAVSFPNGAAPSPVVTVQLAGTLSDPDEAEEFWSNAELEYSASPYFRLRYFDYLAQSGQTDRSMEKLRALIQEMPWIKEAHAKLARHVDQRPAFNAAWQRTLVRFSTIAGMGVLNINLTHPETRLPVEPWEGLSQTYAEWLDIPTEWDRRALLLGQLGTMMGSSLAPWQAAEFYVAQRSAEEALEVIEGNPGVDSADPKYGFYCAACARTLLTLDRLEEGLTWAKRAVAAMPENRRIRTLHADLLHRTGATDEAHEIYDDLFKDTPPSVATPEHAIEEKFRSLFDLTIGVVPSPVMAIHIGEGIVDPNQADEFWNYAEPEFYCSPYFRMHHAYYLAVHGQMDRSLAKLAFLVEEMPWLAEATLNLASYFEQLDPTGMEIMPELQAAVRQAIADNGWTA